METIQNDFIRDNSLPLISSCIIGKKEQIFCRRQKHQIELGLALSMGFADRNVINVGKLATW